MIISIGASLGGLTAVQTILSALPVDFQGAIAIVLHREKDSGEMLAELLQRACVLPVSEVEDKTPIQASHVYLAPINYHLLVDYGYFSLSTEAPVLYARPSIDVLFKSVADAYRKDTIGVILTGANTDGTDGLMAIKQYGGLTVAQDPDTATCPVMPESAIHAGVVQKVLPLEEIGPFLALQCSHSVNL